MSDNLSFYNAPQALAIFEKPVGLWSGERILIEKFFTKTDGKILILGCGGGRTVIPLIQMGYQVTALDFSPKMIEITEAKLKKFNLSARTIVGDAANLGLLADQEFDYVFFPFNGLDCLYPLEQRTKCLLEIRRVLKTNGFFIYSTHNLFSRRHFLNYVKSRIKPFVVEDDLSFGKLTLFYANPFSEPLVLKKIFDWADVYSTRFLKQWSSHALAFLVKWPLIFLSRFIYLVAQKK